MKKTLLLALAMVLVAAVFFGCQNTLSGDIGKIAKPDSTAGVAADTIKAAALGGGILVQWDAAEEGVSYQVYRKEVKDGEPVEATLALLGNSSRSPLKRIPYYYDSALKNGVTYQYGIVAYGYKTNTMSDIVWQEETDSGKYAVAAVYAVSTAVDIPAFPSATVNKINFSHPSASGMIDVSEYADIVITGLVPGYDYEFSFESVNLGTNATITEFDWRDQQGGTNVVIDTIYQATYDYRDGSWAWWYNYNGSWSSYTVAEGNNYFGWSLTPNYGDTHYFTYNTDYTAYWSSAISNYVDEGAWTVTLPGKPLNIQDYVTTTEAFKYWQGRVVAEISPAVTNAYFQVTSAGASAYLRSNQKVITAANVTP